MKNFSITYSLFCDGWKDVDGMFVGEVDGWKSVGCILIEGGIVGLELGLSEGIDETEGKLLGVEDGK